MWGVGGRNGEGGVMLTRNIKGKRGGRRGEKRGDTEIREMLENGRKYELGAGLSGRHDEKTTGLS